TGELGSPGMGEARPRLRLELVAGEVLRLELERVVEVGLEVGGGLARNPVDEIERDVVESGITEMMHAPPDVVRTGNTLEHLEERRPERLGADRDARDAGVTQRAGELRRHGLGIRLDGDLLGRRERFEQALEIRQRGEGRRAAPEEDRLERLREPAALELELPQQRVDVGGVLPAPADDGYEVAVAAAMGAERQMDVEVPGSAHEPFP